MTGFLWNGLLAIVWTMITGNFAPANVVFGFVLGFLVLLLVGPVVGSGNYASRVLALGKLSAFFLAELVVSNVQMAYDVLRPGLRMRPGVIAIPIAAETDVEIVLLANLITLTPGSLSLDISDDHQTLYLHTMDMRKADKLVRKVKDGFERRILAVTR